MCFAFIKSIARINGRPRKKTIGHRMNLILFMLEEVNFIKYDLEEVDIAQIYELEKSTPDDAILSPALNAMPFLRRPF
jgi:hypothetical protein